MKRLVVIGLLLMISVTGCTSASVDEPIVETPVTEAPTPVQVESISWDIPVSMLDVKSIEVKDIGAYVSTTVESYIKYKGKCTVLTNTDEYTVDSLATAKLMFRCSKSGIPIMSKVSSKGTITSWYAVIANVWYRVDSEATLDKVCQYVIADPTDIDYPVKDSISGTISGTVTAVTDGSLSVSVDGNTYTVMCETTDYAVSDFVTLAVTINKDHTIATKDYIASDDVTTVYECPAGYAQIKVANFECADDTNTICTTGGDYYTTTDSKIAELITLAYHSGLDVYIKTGEDLFAIQFVDIVDKGIKLNITTPAELMQYVNANAGRAKLGKYTKNCKLLAVTPSVNVHTGTDLMDSKPFYSFHYAVLRQSDGTRIIAKYTSKTKGIDYLDLDKYHNKALHCTYTVFDVVDASGTATNYILDEVSK